MDKELYNLSVEKAIINSLIFDPALFEQIENTVKKEDFYHPSHQQIFGAIQELYFSDAPIDEMFIKKRLEKDKEYDENVFLQVLSASPLANLEPYVGELQEKARKRSLFKLSSAIQTSIVEQDIDASKVIDSVESELFNLSQVSRKSDFREALEIVNSTRELVKERMERDGSELIGVDTGFTQLNEMTTGFGEGDLIIVGARPAMGKTAFALNIVDTLIKKGDGVAFFSLEMPAEQLMLRILSMRASVPLQNIRKGNLDDDQQRRVEDSLAKIAKEPLYVDDQGSVNINQLRSKLRKLVSKHSEIRLAVVDYLQIMSSSTSKDRHLEVSDISRGLKMLARELKIPIIALSQLNRSLESRNDKRPMLSDIRESGSIEQDADIILFVYRDDVYLFKEEKEREKQAKKEGKEFVSTYVEKPEEKAEIIIGKQRNGPTGHVNLVFQKRFTRFVDDKPKEIEITYETVDTSSAQMNIPDEQISMPIL
jgi:replicative DNA helicase